MFYEKRTLSLPDNVSRPHGEGVHPMNPVRLRTSILASLVVSLCFLLWELRRAKVRRQRSRRFLQKLGASIADADRNLDGAMGVPFSISPMATSIFSTQTMFSRRRVRSRFACWRNFTVRRSKASSSLRTCTR